MTTKLYVACFPVVFVLLGTACAKSPAPGSRATAGASSRPSVLCPNPVDPFEQRDRVFTLPNGRGVLGIFWAPRSVIAASQDRMQNLMVWAAQSTCSSTPLASSCSGLVSAGQSNVNHGYEDVMLITPQMLIWFDRTAAHPMVPGTSAIPDGGGGMVRGVWLLAVDATGNLNFAFPQNHNRGVNELLPGAKFPNTNAPDALTHGSGLSFFITTTAVDNGHTANMENDVLARLNHHSPRDRVEPGTPVEEFLVQMKGRIIYRGEQMGSLHALTNTRISGCAPQFSTEAVVYNGGARVGPIEGINISTNHYGAENGSVYAANGISFADTKPETCIARTRSLDTPIGVCETGGYWYARDFAQREVAFQSKPNLHLRPPTYRLQSLSSGATPRRPTLTVRASAGVSSARFIYDTHSLSDHTVVPSWDGSLFNRSECFTADVRVSAAPCDTGNLPSFILRSAQDFYIAPAAVIRGAVHLSWQ